MNEKRQNEIIERVWKGLRNYEDDNATRVRDMLTDLRHFCDVYAIDFGEEDRIAHDNYLAELGRTT